jgi:hypothetical protein
MVEKFEKKFLGTWWVNRIICNCIEKRGTPLIRRQDKYLTNTPLQQELIEARGGHLGLGPTRSTINRTGNGVKIGIAHA